MQDQIDRGLKRSRSEDNVASRAMHEGAGPSSKKMCRGAQEDCNSPVDERDCKNKLMYDFNFLTYLIKKMP